jgi:putative ABC transport system ATP-binding protein
MSLLSITHLHHAWHSQPALLSVPSLQVDDGESIFLHGPSGSGKSTLLALIAGVLTPDSGKVFVFGTDITRLSASKRDQWRADHIGFIFQQFNLLPYLGVLVNVLLPLRFSRARRRRLQTVPRLEAERLLTALKLPAALWNQRADSLSIGQQQRVAVARALIGRPALIIADEPTSALDADTQEAFLELLFQECEQHGTALIFVSHDLRLSTRFDRILALSELNQVATV